MYNDLFSIGPFTVHGYGLMIGIGIVVAVMVAMHQAKKKGLDSETLLDLALLAVPGGLLGAKFMYLIVELPDLIAGKMSWETVLSGFVVYGGIIGGVFTAWLYCKIKKKPFLKYVDIAFPVIALAQGFGRLGCFLAGCCYGKETDSFFGIVFTNSDFAPNGVKLLPTQLISSAADFLLAGFLFFLAKKNKKDGRVGCTYLIFYGIGRFLIEFLRDDPRGSVGGLSTSQFISLFMVALGVGLYIFLGRLADKAASDAFEALMKEQEENETEEENEEAEEETEEENEETETEQEDVEEGKAEEADNADREV